MGRQQRVWYVDIETAHWDIVLCICAKDASGNDTIVMTNPAGLRAAAPDAPEGLKHAAREAGREVLRQFRHRVAKVADVLWGHAAGLFDWLLVWESSGLPREVVLAGSSVMRAKSDDGITWRDTMPRWLTSLEKVGKAVGIHKMTDVDRANLHRYTMEEIVAYCMRDVDVLREGSLAEDAWLAKYNVKANTSGSAAVELLRALDPDTWRACSRNAVPRHVLTGVLPEELVEPRADLTETPHSDTADIARSPLAFIRGGRCETRRIGDVLDVFVYDLHSSYPSQYGKGAVPVGCVPDDSTDLHDVGWVDQVSWNAEKRATWKGPIGSLWSKDPPLLYVKTALELGGSNYGAGRLSAPMTWEMAQWLEKAGARPRRHGIGFKGTRMVENFAKQFVDVLYTLKEGGGVESFFAKVTLNSLHGRLGMNPEREKLVLPRDADLTGPFTPAVYEEEPVSIPDSASIQPLAAATILGRARLTLAQAIWTIENVIPGGQFFYCDTDSVHCNVPPELFERFLPLSPALGHWGFEGHFEMATYLGPKTYVLHGDKPKLVAKGLPVKETVTTRVQTPDGDRFKTVPVMKPDTFRAALGEPQKLTRTGVGRFRSTSMGQFQELSRTLKPNHRGRVLAPDGQLHYLTEDEEP